MTTRRLTVGIMVEPLKGDAGLCSANGCEQRAAYRIEIEVVQIRALAWICPDHLQALTEGGNR